MKKRFSDEQIISILAKLKPGFLPVSSTASTPSPTPPFIPGVKSMVVWRCPRLSA